MSKDSLPKKIAELFELHKSGLLSKEEYEMLKSKLLSPAGNKEVEKENIQAKTELQKPQEEVNGKTTDNNDSHQTNPLEPIANTTGEPIKDGDSHVPSQKRRSKKAIIILIGLAVVVISGILIGLYIKRNETRTELLLAKQQILSDSLKNIAESKKNEESKTTAEEPLNIISVTASSFMNPSGNLSYYPSNATDHNLQSWWTPSPPHSDGYNSWLRIDFGQNRKVTAIEIHNGSHYPNYQKYGDLYFKNNRLLKANLEFSNGTTVTINLREVDEIQRLSISMQNTTYIKLIPLEWARGTQWNDLCISEFTAIGE
jgi:hypothetical protein